MNHTLLSVLPHISKEYNRSRYYDRLFRCNNQVEVDQVLSHGIHKRNLKLDDLMYIYAKMDRVIDDSVMEKVNWVMTYLDPVLTRPHQPFHIDPSSETQTVPLWI